MAAKPEQEEPRRVREGVFFGSRQALPRGRHSLTEEEVMGIQKERSLVAVTELLADSGPRAFGSGEIARRAGVSLGAFYACFDSKEECILAGYDRFIEVLITRMIEVELNDKSRPELVQALLGTYLMTLQSDLVVARAYQLEIDSLGAAARKRRRDSLVLFAQQLWDVFGDGTASDRGPEVLPWSAYIGVVYATRQLASDLLETEPEPDLVGLGDELAIWVADLFR